MSIPPPMPSCCPSTRRARSRRSTARSRGCLEEGTVRRHDPRLQARRHHHTVCRPQRARRHAHRPQRAAPPPSGIHPFLNDVEAEVPAGKIIHAIVDNYASHKLSAQMARQPSRWTSTSRRPRLLAQCRRKLLRQALPAAPERGVFRSVVDLQAAINRFIAETNPTPSPSSGPPTPTASSLLSNEGSKR